VLSSLQTLSSVSTLLLTSDALIADMPEDKKPAGGGGHGGYDDMY
jgi:chaperonin GroEL